MMMKLINFTYEIDRILAGYYVLQIVIAVVTWFLEFHPTRKPSHFDSAVWH